MNRYEDIRITGESPDKPGVLERYASVSIAFEVTSRFVVRPVRQGLRGLWLSEEAVAAPYVKDYDALESEGPLHWRDRFDLSQWVALMAYDGAILAGGAAVAWNTLELDMLEGRDDLAVLWDLRVSPVYRGLGLGHRLFVAAEDWARQHGCRSLKVETQNINVTACRFYARQGCELRSIRQDAYPGLPEEAQMLWYKALESSGSAL